MELAVAGLIVVVVVLAGALIHSRRRIGRDNQPSVPGGPPPGEVQPISENRQLAVRGASDPEECLLEDGSGRQLFAQLIEPGESVLWKRADTVMTQQSSSVALDKVLDTVPVIGVAVKGGKWVRILNPEALALGDQIKSKSGGFLAGIYGSDKKFAAQLRFTKPEDIAKVATPLAVFKVASMVTGHHYLNRINGQLMTIEGQVRQIRQELRNETYGEITSAAEACMELEEGLALSLDLTSDERIRLVNAEGDIDKAYKQKLKDVQDFLDDVDQLFTAEKLDVDRAEQLLKEADSTRMYDVQLLAYAAAVCHKLNLLRAELDLDAEGGRGELAQRKLQRELAAMRADLLAASDALARLGVSREEAKATWNLRRWQRPPKLLDQFQPRGSAMHKQLAEAPRTLLPSPEPAPFVLEAFVDERGLVQVLSATPTSDPYTPRSTAEAPVAAPAGNDERKQLRLKVLLERQHELEGKDDGEALRAVVAQVAEVEAEIEALRGRAGFDRAARGCTRQPLSRGSRRD
jgi:hypothetical protein